MPDHENHSSSVPILILGADPTGLTLAAQLQVFGVEFRIIDRTPQVAHESRALAVQARTLEIRTAQVELGGFAAKDTRFPFILFVSQAETEALLGDHLARAGRLIERRYRRWKGAVHD